MKFLTSRVKSNAFAAVLGGIAYLGYKFTGYWASDMQKEISQLWTDSRHVNHIFKYLVEDSPAVAALVALFNDLRSPKDKQGQEETAPQPPVAPAQPQIPGPVIELESPIPKVVRPQPDISLEPAKNYFSEAELDCKGSDCQCKFPGMNKRIMEIANAAREELGPLIVNSAYRCPVHNANVGGVRNSKHVLAMALDLRSPTRSADELYTYFDQKYPDTLGLGLYDKFIHVDSRIEQARWDNRTVAMVP